MANLRKRSGKWQVQVRRKGLQSLCRTFPTKTDALRWARETETCIDQGAYATSDSMLAQITVGDPMVRYRDTVVALKRCWKVEADMVNSMLRQPFTNIRLSDVTPQPFAAYIAS